jgi:pimeloyl-ACP methyl ester carboxylesterase
MLCAKEETVMLRLLVYILLVFSISLVSGCSTKVGLFICYNINPLEFDKIKFKDGHTSKFYTVQKGNTSITDTLIFFVGGSGNVSLNYYLQAYFEELPGNITIYALQKRYVSHRETGLFKPLSSFYNYNHYSQLVQDQKEFIQYILANTDHTGKRIIIFGVSEGGNIAAQVSSEIPETTHLLLLGSGGMVGIEEFKLWGDSRSIDFGQINQKVAQYPDSIEKKALGHTYKYWASVLPVDPMDSLEKLETPIFAAIGENDEMVPVESVHFMVNEFKRLGKDNLTVQIFPDCNHVLNDSSGKNYRGELFQLVTSWWKEQ